MPRARSIYKQIRLTVTEERGGFVTVRVLAKPVNAEWTMRDSVWHHRWRHDADTAHWTDLLVEAVEVLVAERLPGVTGPEGYAPH